VSSEDLGEGLHRVAVRVANTSPWRGGTREQAMERTFCSTHAVLHATRGEFVSLTDPPEELRALARACRNEGVWPVLVGEPHERHTVLASPIILEDHPQIAPESPGDLFDGGEIDQMLTLNILALTDEEKAEMRASDPRAREILERTEQLSEQELMSLHGAVRDLRQVR
jgi:hydrogenase maturation protease